MNTILLDGFSGGISTTNGNFEVSLDIEGAIAMAPGLSSVNVYEGNPGIGKFVPDDIFDAIANPPNGVPLSSQISSSWTWDGTGYDSVMQGYFNQFALQGQSFFQASGDFGAYLSGEPTPTVPSPMNIISNLTAVGGTELATSSAGGSWLSESTWNNALEKPGNAASGGGICSGPPSTLTPIPTYQVPFINSSNEGSISYRNVPDVSAIADYFFVVYNNGTSGGGDGTSFATPLWAGFMSLVNQQAASSGKGPIGFANPALYTLAASPTPYYNDFHDIADGSNNNFENPTTTPIYPAVKGYDLATGLGSPQCNLIPDLVGQAPTLGPTNTFTVTFTSTPTKTQTLTLTYTPTRTTTSTFTVTVTRTPTKTFTATHTGTPTKTPTVTKTSTRTDTATVTHTATRTGTPTDTETPTKTQTPASTSTPTCTTTSTDTPTFTPTLSITSTFTITATPTNSPTVTSSNTSTLTFTPTPTCAPGGGPNLSWSPATSMPMGLFNLSAAAVGGVLYAAGGEASGSNLYQNGTEVFNPNVPDWQPLASMPVSVASAGTGVIGGIMYIVGGNGPSGALSSVEAYNIGLNSWSTVASMPIGLSNFGVGVVNGILYAVGGTSSTGISNLVEAYNPVSNSWSTCLATMPTGLTNLGVGVVNGILYAVGGQASSGVTNLVETYNPVLNSWGTSPVIAAMPTARQGLTVSVIGGTLYAIGGNASSGVTNLVEAYNSSTNTWSEVTSMPTAREFLSSGVINGTIYAVGGLNSGISAANEAAVQVCPPPTATPTLTLTPTLTFTPTPTCATGMGPNLSWSPATSTPRGLFDFSAAAVGGVLYVAGGESFGQNLYQNETEVYNPGVPDWQPLASMPISVAASGTGVINGMMYVVGGTTSTGASTNSVEAFNTSTSSWSASATVAPMPISITGLGVGVVNGILYAVGGSASSGTNNLEAYNPVSNSWSTCLAPMPVGLTNLGVGVVNGIIYAVGGQASSGVTNLVEAYNPVLNSWSISPAIVAMPTARQGLTVSVIGGTLYAIGGNASSGVTNLVEAYNTSTNTWSEVTSMPTARMYLSSGVINGTIYAVGGLNSGISAANEAALQVCAVYTSTPTPGVPGSFVSKASALSDRSTSTITPTLTITPSPTLTSIPTNEFSVVAAPNISREGQPIQFLATLGEPSQITLSIYTILGEQVYQTSVEGQVGINSLPWQGRNTLNESVASGLYIYSVQANDGKTIRNKMGKVAIIH